MIDNKLLESIQILAIKSIDAPDSEDVYRKICRWYSKEFSTPLTQVEDLDPVHVLLNFFESRYEEVINSGEKGAAEFEKIKEQLIYPELVENEEKQTQDWMDRLKAEMAEQKQKNLTKKGEEIGKQLADSVVEKLEQASEELNLIPEEYKLPDSGSMGE